MFSILGVRVMNESGDRSSRLRCAVRAALVWIPAAALSFTGYCLRLLSMVPEGMDNAHVKESGGSSPFVQMLFGTPLNTLQAFDWVPAALVVSSMLLMGFGVLVAIRTPAKALPDWIARTYLARW